MTKVLMRSAEFGDELFTGYASTEEAADGLRRLALSAFEKTERDGILRSLSLVADDYGEGGGEEVACGTGLAVEAECHTDDHVYEVKFNAAPFLTAATDDVIRQLAACGWGGDYPADDVVLHCADADTDLGMLFDYLSRVARTSFSKDAVGFECHLDVESVRAWLRENRPALEGELFENEEGNA